MIVDTLTDREKLKGFRKSRIAWREKVDKGQLDYSMEEQQKAMGKWIAEYFDDAGYEARARAGRVAPPWRRPRSAAAQAAGGLHCEPPHSSCPLRRGPTFPSCSRRC